jgi:hypothetical protein
MFIIPFIFSLYKLATSQLLETKREIFLKKLKSSKNIENELKKLTNQKLLEDIVVK